MRLPLFKTLFLLLFLAGTEATAQKPTDMQNTYSGLYAQGSREKLGLFDDGYYVAAAFESVVIGTYNLREKFIRLIPGVREEKFEIMGRFDPTTTDSLKLTVDGIFAKHKCYIQFDEGPIMRFYDTTDGSPGGYFTAKVAGHPRIITLINEEPARADGPNALVFLPPPTFNNFLIDYNESPSREQSQGGRFQTENGEMRVAFRGGNLVRDNSDTRVLGFMREALVTWLNEHAQKIKADSVFYLNSRLASFPDNPPTSDGTDVPSIANDYVFDASSNVFVAKTVYKKGGDYNNRQARDIDDDTYLLKFYALPAGERKEMIVTQKQVSPKALLKLPPLKP